MAELIYVDDSLPGITRKGAGKGWAYYDAKGELITDQKERARLNAIALPPAYTDAWYCPASNGHILATGIDARGRKQYRYHPDFRTMRESEKFNGCVTFAKLLPLLRARVAQDLNQPALSQERAVASLIRLLDLSAIRIGNEEYARENETYGATTLRQDHLKLTGKTLRLRYTAKGGQKRLVSVIDGNLARAVRRMQDLPGQNLFQFVDDDGDHQAISSRDVNEYIAEAMGERFTAKNFRTWHASVEALTCLVQAEETLSIKALAECVSERLGNTPTIARKSYIHPAVIEIVEYQEAWRDELTMPRSTKWLSREERLLIDLLEQAPNAEELLAA